MTENGDISNYLHEDFPTFMKVYHITANRKRLRTLKQIAAYNVAKCISSESDIEKLHIPQSFYKLVSMILDTNSGNNLYVFIK